MKILSWNVQGAFPPQGSPDRISRQIEYIQETAQNPDVLMLNEVSTNRRELWHDHLKDIGYNEVTDTLDIAREIGESEIPPYHDRGGSNGNLTAIHRSSQLQNLTRHLPGLGDDHVEDSDLKHWSTNFPEKVLNTTVEVPKSDDGVDLGLDLWNVRTVPGSMYGEEKIKILEDVYHRILKKKTKYHRVLAGDFNSPKDETKEGEVIPFGEDKDGKVGRRWRKAERNFLTGLKEAGMVDVFREVHGYGDLDVLDVSHATRTEDPLSVPPEDVRGVRFDHIIASTELQPQGCRYDQDGFRCSDHAPLIAEFGIEWE